MGLVTSLLKSSKMPTKRNVACQTNIKDPNHTNEVHDALELFSKQESLMGFLYEKAFGTCQDKPNINLKSVDTPNEDVTVYLKTSASIYSHYQDLQFISQK